MQCWLCGSTEPDDFTLYNHSRVCDDCRSILNYWYREAIDDLRTRHRAISGLELDEGEFLEGCAEFIDIKQTEYNAERRRETNENGRTHPLEENY